MSKKDLLKKHPKYKYFTTALVYQKGDLIDKILTRLSKQLSQTKSGILKNALFSYNIFIQQSMKEEQKKEKGEDDA